MLFKRTNVDSSKIFFLFLFLFLYFFSVSAKGDYSNELMSGAKIIFHHWNVEKSEVTGYSNFLYEKINKNGQQFILEKNENTKKNGEVFTRKKIWFDVNSGMPIRYEEEDFRKDFRIISKYSDKKIKTNLYRAGKILDFETKKGLADIVPMEIFFFFLRKNFQHILISDSFSFTLFLPLLAMELEEKGLPRSMSMIQMIVDLKEEKITDSILGQIWARKLIIFPKSALLRALLPSEKTNFELLIAENSPHHILEFKVGKTKHILKELTFLE